MMGLIEETIPSQGFEIVRDRISEILNSELQDQIPRKNITYSISVDTERNNAVDTVEDVLVNILFNNSDFSQFTEIDRQGNTEYYIDVYATGVSTNLEQGSLVSAKKVQEVIGMISYILSHEVYKILGFDPGSIGGTYVTNIRMSDTQNNGDTKYLTHCRITFDVRIQNNQMFRNGVALGLSKTTIKHNESEKGVLLEKQ